MPRSRDIEESSAAGHINREPTFIDALLMLVNNDGGLGRRRRDDLGVFRKNAIIILAGKRSPAHPAINTVAAHPRSSASGALVRRAAINSRGRAILPESAVLEAIDVRGIEHTGIDLAEDGIIIDRS